MTLPHKSTFDCVYVRSCSLYNCMDLQARRGVTEIFLSYLKKGGALIFDHNSKLSPLDPNRRGSNDRYIRAADFRLVDILAIVVRERGPGNSPEGLVAGTLI